MKVQLDIRHQFSPNFINSLNLITHLFSVSAENELVKQMCPCSKVEVSIFLILLEYGTNFIILKGLFA